MLPIKKLPYSKESHFYVNMSIQIFVATHTSKIASSTCKTRTDTLFAAFAPNGAPMTAATASTLNGSHSTWPVAILPNELPIADKNVIAKLEAIAVRVGIRNSTSITGTIKKPPPAPTIPDATPTISANINAYGRLNGMSVLSGTALRGTNIINAANNAKMP